VRERYVGRHRDAAPVVEQTLAPVVSDVSGAFGGDAVAPRRAGLHRAPRRPIRGTQLGASALLAGTCVAGYLVADTSAPRVALADAAIPVVPVIASNVTLPEPAFDATEADQQVGEANRAMNTRITSVRAAEQAQAAQAAAEAAAAEVARQAEADRVAREAQRQAIVDQARTNPQAVAALLLPEYGWSSGQMSCLTRLWIGESDWRWNALNRSSGAYGIPQALPASKMASAGADWKTNPVTQIKWGLGYIKSSYGSPCNALAKWQARSPHWY